MVVACSPCVASSVGGERECSLYREFRVAFLQVLGLFEFIAYLTGLNSKPSESSDTWVATRPSGVPGGDSGGRVITVVSELRGPMRFVRMLRAWLLFSLVLRLGFVVGLRVRVGVSRRLREPTCGVAFTGAGLWSAEPVSRLHWWDFMCPQDREVGFVSHTLWSLPDGSLRLIVRISFPCFPLVAQGDVAPLWCCVARASFWCVFLLCLSYALDALVTFGRVALPTCGGRSGALCLHASKSQYGCCALEAVSCGESFLLAMLFR
ncbi:hypothetical protein Taro_050371 [Colocasia esculenta]|uniref:Uncharacterized protein n=1 Tax=Colocasia esculenta TaxID=4460 RepID=A0A843XDQ3_COLES|nr:hypothetical protein [Colocasia esculenta]